MALKNSAMRLFTLCRKERQKKFSSAIAGYDNIQVGEKSEEWSREERALRCISRKKTKF